MASTVTSVTKILGDKVFILARNAIVHIYSNRSWLMVHCFYFIHVHMGFYQFMFGFKMLMINICFGF